MQTSLAPICLALVLTLTGIARAQIFADFETSMGSFTCELHYETVPQTVANFIGLAEGSRAWIDGKTGQVETGKSFYDGVTFHRVIAGFMNQSGSRNGLGTDGPGYRFRDEFSSTLTHTGPGILSMANSGPNSNGGQFFVTVASANHLDGLHSVFGKVTAGMAVVNAINTVPKVQGEPSKPVTPIILNTVTIRRVGAVAEAFDIHAQDLPLCFAGKGRLQVQPGTKAEFVFDEPRPPGSMVPVMQSVNLENWVKLKDFYQGPEAPGSRTIKLDEAKLSKSFYQVPLVTYSDAITPTGPGKTLLVEWDSVVDGQLVTESLTFHFDATGTGGTVKYSESATPSAITGMTHRPTAFDANWIIESSGFFPLNIVTRYKTAGTGTHSLYAFNFGWQKIGDGPFTHTP